VDAAPRGEQLEPLDEDWILRASRDLCSRIDSIAAQAEVLERALAARDLGGEGRQAHGIGESARSVASMLHDVLEVAHREREQPGLASPPSPSP
jgi:hypothetical protein